MYMWQMYQTGIQKIALLLQTGLILIFKGLAQEDYSTARRYVLNLQPLTWDKADEFCKSNGGHLAKLYDISTVPDLNQSEALSGTNFLFWVGLFHREGTGWLWADNTTVTWENWNPKAFGVSSSTNKCATASDIYPFLWNNEVCSKKYPSLCQFEGGQCTFIMYANRSISGHNSLYLYEKSAEECQEKCMTSALSYCVSFDYSPADRVCEFNTGNRWTLPELYVRSGGWNYYHKTCNTGEVITTNLTFIPTTSVPLQPSISSHYIMPCSPVFEQINITITATETVYSTVTFMQMISLSVGNDTMDPVEELQVIQEVLKEKQKQRTKISYEDKRPSATYVGYVAIAFLSCVFGSIILFDLLTVCRDTKIKKKSKRRDSRKYDVLDALGGKGLTKEDRNRATVYKEDPLTACGNRNVTDNEITPRPNETADFMLGLDSVTLAETNEEVSPLPKQRHRLLWKKLWPGFQKLDNSKTDFSAIR